MRRSWSVLVSALLGALVLALGAASVSSSASSAAPGSAGPAGPPRLVTLSVGSDGSLRVVGVRPDRAVQLPASESARQADRSARRTLATRAGVDVVTVEVLDAAGHVTYRRSATVEQRVRAELPRAGSDVLTGRTAPAPDRAVTLGLPGAGVLVRTTSARTGATSDAVPLAAGASAGAAGAAARAGDPQLVPIAGYPSHDPANRLDVVILGDGYTAAQADDFAADAKQVADGLFDITPYSDYLPYLNVVGVFAPSAQSGADHPAYDPGCADGGTSHPISCCPDSTAPSTASYKDTRYDSSYCYYGIQRLLVPIDEPAVQADATTAYPDWDQLLMVVNDEEYGGSGGSLATTSLNPNGLEVMKHELGHGLLKLDDEYTDFTPGYPPCSDTGRAGITDPCAANVTDATTRAQLKWVRWVDVDTAIPTSSPKPASVVGLFQGAHYSPTTWYRSCDSCLMRFLDRPFGAVSAEQMPVRLYSGGWQGPAGDGTRIELVEPGSATPSTPDVTLEPGAQRTFTVTLLSPAGGPGTRVVWSLDGDPVKAETVGGGAQSSYSYTGEGTDHVVSVRATDVAGVLHPDLRSLSASTHDWQVHVTGTTSRQLLPNGGFEKPLTKGWKRTNVPASARHCSGSVGEGRCALALTATRKPRSLTARVGAVADSAAGDELELSALFDPANLQARGTITATVVLADGSRHRLGLRTFPRDPGDTSTYLNRRDALVLTAPVASATVRVTLGRGSGRVLVDGVGLWLHPGS